MEHSNMDDFSVSFVREDRGHNKVDAFPNHVPPAIFLWSIIRYSLYLLAQGIAVTYPILLALTLLVTNAPIAILTFVLKIHRIQRDRLEKERRGKQWLEQQRVEQDRREQAERDLKRLVLKRRLEKRRALRKHANQERREQARLEREHRERGRREQERFEQDVRRQAARDRRRVLLERHLEKQRIQEERLEQRRLEQGRREQDRLGGERRRQADRDRRRAILERSLEQRRERVEQERLVRDRLAREALERDRQTQEQRKQERRALLDKLPVMRYVPAPEGSSRSPGHPVDEPREGIYVRSDLPDLPLDNHRAGCHICMLDFEEPSRVDGFLGSRGEQQQPQNEPEPVRLLPCGHVYHKSCVDLWIVDESATCPDCRGEITIIPNTASMLPSGQRLPPASTQVALPLAIDSSTLNPRPGHPGAHGITTFNNGYAHSLTTSNTIDTPAA